VKSKDEFIENYVLIGRFHNEVPEDVVNAFETVTHLLAYSYYHWPMLDEATSKGLLIVEMAIKLKAKQLLIDLSFTDKRGRTQQKRLVDLINEIFSLPYLSFLKPDFERARQLRNSKMHPDQHSYMGAIGRPKSNAMLFTNIINYLFLSKASLEDLLDRRRKLEIGIANFKHGLFVIERDGKKYLFDTVHFHRYSHFEDSELLILLFNPVLTNVSTCLSEHKFPDPMVVCLKEFIIEDLTIEGLDIENRHIKIYSTEKEQNVHALQSYQNELKLVSEHDIHSYHAYISSKVLWMTEQMVHDHLWIQ
jgi:hypothetical protein